MMTSTFRLSIMAAAAAALTGCASQQLNQQPSEMLTAQSRKMLESTAGREVNAVHIVDKVVLPMVRIKDEGNRNWLAGKRVRLINDKRRPLNLAEVVKMFFDQGINIGSAIPLEGYTYAGLGVQDADAEVALRSILGAVGLDYELDEASRTVLIRPMASRSWKINLGDRKTSFMSNTGGELGTGSTNNTQVQGQNTTTGSAAAAGQAGNTAVSGQAGNAQTSNQNTQISSTTTANGVGGTTSTSDDFWASLRAELKDRMEVLLPGVATTATEISGQFSSVGQPGAVVPAPAPLAPAMTPGPLAAVNGQAVEFYAKKRIGTFSLNPVTGNVTVQGPRWLLNDLDRYIKQIQAEYSYRITFIGQMVLVTTNDSNSEGLDISAFGRFAQSRYGVAFSNNALGGVTVNFPGSGVIPAISTGGQPVAGTLLGVRSPLDGLQVFNAYLQNYGTVNIIQRPILVTSKGVPGYFQRSSRKYFVNYTQQAAAGNSGSAAVASNNTLIPFDFGTTLTISANYDINADLVRANIILDQVVQAGTQTVPQQISSANGGTQQVNQDIPIPSTFKYRGEVPLRDGDLIIIGGQSEDETNTADGGVTGLKNTPLGAVFGQKNSTKGTGTYYFALRVKLSKVD